MLAAEAPGGGGRDGPAPPGGGGRLGGGGRRGGAALFFGGRAGVGESEANPLDGDCFMFTQSTFSIQVET